MSAILATSLMAGSASAAQPEDAWITTKVSIALLSDDVVDGLAIDVDTVDGKVTLQGKAGSEREKELAAERAAEIEGVTEVENMIAVVPPEEQDAVERSDRELEQEISTVLERDSALQDSDIEISSVNDGRVVLEGEASSLDAHLRALQDVRAVQGVKSVSSAVVTPDVERKSEQAAAGSTETRSKPSSAQAKDAAEQAPESARAETEASTDSASADGDSTLANAWLTTKVKMALLSEAGISPFAINVDSRDGVVTLFGIVESEVAMKQAESEAAKLEGVREVKNELQVVPEAAAELQRRTDEAIHDAVSERLSGSTELDGAEIDVEVNNNVVRLRGTVGSESQHARAVELAKQVSGVDSVIDDLRVDRAEVELDS